jgi:competence protein ComEA
MPEISRRRALAYAAALLVALVLLGRLVVGNEHGSRRASTRAPASVGLTAEAVEPRDVVVHVVGAVRRPGLLRLPEGSRVDDAIEAAGGAGRKAALELVNLAAPVADGQQVVVPVAGPAGEGGAGAATPGASERRVQLNSATLEELDRLPGVGPVTAQKILDYREEHGAFASVDELDAVPGIGPGRLEELRALVDL